MRILPGLAQKTPRLRSNNAASLALHVTPRARAVQREADWLHPTVPAIFVGSSRAPLSAPLSRQSANTTATMVTPQAPRHFHLPLVTSCFGGPGGQRNERNAAAA